MDPRLKDILALPENKSCADCGEALPRWSCVNLGIFICNTCAGVHRSLGTHISKVQSVSLDRWKAEWIEKVAINGNALSAREFEALLPKAWSRPSAVTVGGDRMEGKQLEVFIRSKYEQRLFARPDDDDEPPADTGFTVLLRRDGTGPFGMIPVKPALRRGVLQLSGTREGTSADQWNQLRPTERTKLLPGDVVLTVNGVAVKREDQGREVITALQQEEQVLLRVLRPPASSAQLGEVCYSDLLSVAYLTLNPEKLGDVPGILAKHAGKERDVFFRVCGKYAENPEDWCDLAFAVGEYCGRRRWPADMARAATLAEEVATAYRGAKPAQGREGAALEALCGRLIDSVPAPTDAEKAAIEKTVARKAALEKAAAERLLAEEAAAEKVIRDAEAAERAEVAAAAAEREAAVRAAAERAAKREAAEKATAEKEAAEKATAEKEAAEKAAVQKEAAERAAAEKAASEAAAAEKAATEAAAAQKAALKAAAERTAADEAAAQEIAEKAAAQSAAADREVAERAASLQAAAEKEAAERATAGRAAEQAAVARAAAETSESVAGATAASEGGAAAEGAARHAAPEPGTSAPAPAAATPAKDGRTLLEHAQAERATTEQLAQAAPGPGAQQGAPAATTPPNGAAGEAPPSDASPFNGRWLTRGKFVASISALRLSWCDGNVSVLHTHGDRATMVFSGQTYVGELSSDSRKLSWSDGETWVRDVPAPPCEHLQLRFPVGVVLDAAALRERREVLVQEVRPGSAAADAGLRPGDILDSIAGVSAAKLALREETGGLDALTMVVRRPQTLPSAQATQPPQACESSGYDEL